MPIGRYTTRTMLGAAGAVATLAAILPVSQALSGHGAEGWKGAESLTPVAIAPNPSRCGPAPVNLHARFAGSGIDTNGGPYTVAASGCLNTQTRRLSELRATDTYTRNGDSIDIDIDDFTLRVSPVTCVATNKHPVRFTVAGGSGSLARASGHGHFDFAMPYPLCAGARPPFTAYVWFSGTIQT